MTDETSSTAGGEAFSVTELPADAPETFKSPSEAAQYFTSLLDKPKKPAESAPEATAEPELSDEGNADPVTDPGEIEEVEAVKDPPIDRPKSWSKDEDAEWQSLPRTMQQKIVARELERDTGTVRSQQEAANARKAAEAVQVQAEQARQTFETQAKAAEQVLLREQLRDFPDIKTLDDVRTLAANDPFRYLQWDAHQKDLAAVTSVRQDADRRSAHEKQSSWANFVRDESAAFADSAPEYKAKKADYDTKAAAVLREIGFTDDELNKLASGEEKIPLFDRRIQRLLFDRIKLSEIQSAPKAIAAKPVPPVQRPGTSRPSGSEVSAKIQALEATFNRTGNVKDATALYAAQMEAQSRRRA